MLPLKVTKLKGISFETAIIERYHCRESSMEEALIEMYPEGVYVWHVDDITEVLLGNTNMKYLDATVEDISIAC